MFVPNLKKLGFLNTLTMNNKEIVQNATGIAAEIAVPFSIKTSVGEKIRIFAMDSSLIPIFEGYDYRVD